MSEYDPPDEQQEQDYNEAFTRLRSAYYFSGLDGIRLYPKDVKTVIEFHTKIIQATVLLTPADLTYEQQCRYIFNELNHMAKGHNL